MSSYYWQNETVRLRLWEPKDAEFCYLNEMDSNCMIHVQEEVTIPPARKKVDINGDSAEPNEKAPAFTIETLDGEYIGDVHFNYINERHGTFSMGMIILKEQRGKGYGKATMEILFEYAFNERRLHKFEGFCLDNNTASTKMMESLGCTLEGNSRECVFLNGKYHNRLLYSLLESEYRHTT